jgi:hypothetical protein
MTLKNEKSLFRQLRRVEWQPDDPLAAVTMAGRLVPNHRNMMMFCRITLLGLAAWASVALVGSARADTIYSTGFENPPFAAGSQLSGQEGWFAPSAGSPPGFPFNLNPGAAIISTANPLTGTQSVQVLGSNLQADTGIAAITGGYYTAIGSYRHAVDYNAGPAGITTVQASLYVGGPITAGTNFFSASVAAVGSGGTGLGELAISSDGMVHAYTGDDLVPTFLFNASTTLGRWHTLAVVDNFAAQTSSFYVDGVLLGTAAFASDYAGDSTLARGSILTYAGTETANFQKANYAAYYDNFSISSVPEPSGIILLGIGSAALLGVARRSRKT